MRILFVENREKTKLWERVALVLRQQGHSISWLVQNPQFLPSAFAKSPNVCVIKFPSRRNQTALDDDETWIRRVHPSLLTDRGRRYFEAGTSHYKYYSSNIEQILGSVNPDVVIGEATLFHELMTIDHCRANGISYISPNSNRYPKGRFSLFSYDTQVPVIGSGDEWPVSKARELAERIGAGQEAPFYMGVPTPVEGMYRRANWVFTRGKVWWGRLRGEHYNTPSLIRKVQLYREVVRNLSRWAHLEKLPSYPQRTILYPLQLQPESNIDVWGRPFSDQINIVRSILDSSPSEVEVALKVNPKAKYELSDELLGLAEREKRISLLPLRMSMNDGFRYCIGAVTVTGTVGLEAVCGKGRSISLRHPIIEKEFPDFFATSPHHAVQRLLGEPTAGVGSVELGTKLIQKLVRTSFEGLVSDPVTHPHCMNKGNIDHIAKALSQFLSRPTESDSFQHLKVYGDRRPLRNQ